MASKWAVSTDPWEKGTATEDPTGLTMERAAITRGPDLWRQWEQLSGGGPIQTNLERTAFPALRLEARDQAPVLTIRYSTQGWWGAKHLKATVTPLTWPPWAPFGVL
jgi:hypothetical protein